MRARLWPIGIRYIRLGSSQDFLAFKMKLLNVLADVGEVASNDAAAEDIHSLPKFAHSAFVTTGPGGTSGWNLKYSADTLGQARLSWVPLSAGVAGWRNALPSALMHKLVESCTLDFATGYADSSAGGWLMSYLTLLRGQSILARLSWIYVYMKCIRNDAISQRSSITLAQAATECLRDIESYICNHIPIANEVKTLRLAGRDAADLRKTLDSALERCGDLQVFTTLLKKCGLSWVTWRKT